MTDVQRPVFRNKCMMYVCSKWLNLEESSKFHGRLPVAIE